MRRRSALAPPPPQGTRQGGRRKNAGPGNGWMVFSLFLFGLLVATAAFPTFLVLAAGLTPAAVAGMLNTRHGRSAFVCVFLANLCGVIPAVIKLWSSGNSLSAALLLFSDPFVWLAMYASAAMGWLLVWMGPAVADVVLAVAADHRAHKLRNFQERLIGEWGHGVAQTVYDSLSEPEGHAPSRR